MLREQAGGEVARQVTGTLQASTGPEWPGRADGGGGGDSRADQQVLQREKRGALRGRLAVGLDVRRERRWRQSLARVGPWRLAPEKSEGRRRKAAERHSSWSRLSEQMKGCRTSEENPTYGEHEAADWRAREVDREGGLRNNRTSSRSLEFWDEGKGMRGRHRGSAGSGVPSGPQHRRPRLWKL